MPDYTQVLWNLTARDLKVKYQTKALGFIWSLLDPAIMLAIWWVIFHNVARFNIPHYWAFLIAGIIPFQFFSSGIADVSNAIRRNANIVRKVYVPMEIFVLSAVLVRTVEFLLQMILVLALLALLHHGLPQDGAGAAPHFSLVKALVVLPGAIGLMLMTVVGIGLPLAAWSVIYRDLDHIISVSLRALLFLSPVFWSFAITPKDAWWKKLFILNPATGLLDLFRGPLYYGDWPVSQALEGGPMVAWGVMTGIAVLSLLVGMVLFDRSKRILAEVV